MKTIKSNKKNISKIDPAPGVYQFLDSKKTVLYVGKAKNLKSRLTSYFAKGLQPKTKKMVDRSEFIKIIPTNSEFEALLLEANLVKKEKPFYNIELKDDKSPLYIVITKEKYPRVLSARQTQLKKYKSKNVYGPFLNASSTRKVLKSIRRVFPFSTHKLGKKPCIYSQINLCNPCPNLIEQKPNKEKLKKQYLKNIRGINGVLSGNLTKVLKNLDKEMRELSKKQEFEKAQEVSEKIKALKRITTDSRSPSQYTKDPNLLEDIRQSELQELKNFISDILDIKKLERIECFDVAHISGTNSTASMVTFIGGEPEKKYYRHFKVDPKIKNNDYKSIKSVLERRSKYFSDSRWGRPDLLIIDGGKPQVSAATQVIGDQIPVVGIAKRDERLIIKIEDKFTERKLPKGGARNLIQRIRNEAHRFAQKYHHKLLTKNLLAKK